jgi:uncharacterized protein (TIGR02145 family)
VVGTFANFPSTYSASTYVTLTDERDSKNYTVVKIGGRWIMGQNLNYQGTTNGSNTFTLYFNADANKANGLSFTSSGSGTFAIGSFWCPGSATSSVRTNCNYWGAFYTWETAVMVDGKWNSDAHTSSSWSESSFVTYNTGAANSASATINHGRKPDGSGRGGRGICPPNWHVPTDNEWGLVLDAMESTTSTAHSTASSSDWYGTNAGTRGKARCSTNSSDTNPTWSSGAGTDDYNFRILPTDDRNGDDSSDSNRGFASHLWSSSANSASGAWYRGYNSGDANVLRGSPTRSYGYSIRCIRD